jgi:hypothetical protein
MRAFSWTDAFRAVLPTEEQTQLLRVCLHSGEPARQAWRAWQEHVGDIASAARENGEIKGLLPLIYHSLRRNEIETDKDVLSTLRTAYAHEQLRHTAYREIFQNVLSAFAREGIAAIVLKGAALADAVYDEPALRHCHDIDLLLEGPDLSRVARLLPALGFAPLNHDLGPTWQDAQAEHSSGLPLALHRSLFRVSPYNEAFGDVWRRSEAQTIADVSARVLSPADSLLHVCGHAFSSWGRRSLRWVCDGWLIIRRYPQLDWECLLDRAEQGHLVIPLSVTLGYLAEELHTPIPRMILERLARRASQHDGFARDLAVSVARASVPGGFGRLLRMAWTWPTRARLLWWMLVPSADYVRWFFHVRRTWLLPFYYVHRPLGYVVYRVKSYLDRRSGSWHL